MGAAYEPADLDDALAGRDLYDDGDAHPADGRPAAAPGRDGGLAALGGHPRLAGGQRAVPQRGARHPRRRRPDAVARHPRLRPGAVAVERVERRPQRPDDARVPARPRRGRDQRPRRATSACGTSPSASTRRASSPSRARRRSGSATNAGCRALGIARATGHGAARRADPRRRRRRAGRRRGQCRRVARRPRPARAGSFAGPHRAALALRRHRPRPEADGATSSSSTTSWRCTSRPRSAGGATSRFPVLHGDRLVGKLDATADRKAGRLFVDAVHEDVPFTAADDQAVDAEIAALADAARPHPRPLNTGRFGPQPQESSAGTCGS